MGKLGWRVRMSKWEVCTRGMVREDARVLALLVMVHGGSPGAGHDDDDGYDGEGCPGDKLIVQTGLKQLKKGRPFAGCKTKEK